MKAPQRRVGLCTISVGEESGSERKDVDSILNDPEMQEVANETGLAVRLICEEFGVDRTWLPQ